MIIPYQSLNPETLTAIIEAFVLQEGTDYGEIETSLSVKIEQVKQQLKQGCVVVAYSQLHESVTILPAEQFKQHADYNEY